MSLPANAAAPSAQTGPVLFLSHAGADTDAARKLAEQIEATEEARAAGLKVWVDKVDLEPGRGWQQQLERAITEQSTAFAVYVGASGVVNWVDSEVRLALSRARKDESYHFIPIISAKSSGSSALPPFAGQYHGVRDIENDPAELAKLIRVVLNREPRAPVRLVDKPFPGLVPFDEDKSHLFFGRETETEELVERLRRNPLLMVVGGSGSGKSSLVRAGLVPRFRGGALADRSGDRPDESVWHVVITRPRGQPFEALADALAEAGRKVEIETATLGAVKDWVRTERPEKVRDALLHGAPQKAKILLVVDQFEELLTQTREPFRRPFIDALLNLVADPADTTVRVVLTMRQDYYNLSSVYPALYGRFETDRGAAKYPIPRMKEEGLRACIREPLKLAGIEDSRVLEDEVVKDVGEDRASQLALVQMALSEAWRYRNDGEFGGDLLKAYVGRGRVAGALAKAADEAYEKKLADSEQALAEAIFIRLVQLGDTGGTTRRIASRDEFSDEAWKLAQKLADEDHRRLLVIRGEEGAETAELSHEALVTQWPRYQGWLQASADLKRIHDRVIPAAKAWIASDRSRRALLAGNQLDEGAKLVTERPSWLSGAERQFLDSSRAAARRQMVLRWAAVGSLLLLTGTSTAVGWYAYEWGIEAEKQQLRALARQLEAQAEAALDGTADGLVHSALLAIKSLEAAYTLEGHVALNRALRLLPPAADVEISGVGGPVLALAFSPDGSTLASGDASGAVTLWHPATGEMIRRLDERRERVTSVAFSPDGRLLAAGGGHATHAWELPAADAAHQMPMQEEGGTVAFSPDGRLLAAASEGDTVQLLDTENWRPAVRLEGDDPVRKLAAAFSPDGRWLVTGGGMALWALPTPPDPAISDAATARLVTTLDPNLYADTVVFSPDGRWLAGAGHGTGGLWKFGDRPERATLQEINWDDVRDVAFSPDGRYLATVDQDGARIWRPSDGTEVSRLIHGGNPAAVAFSPDGLLLATGSDDSIKLWRGFDQDELERLHDGHGVHAVAFSSDGRWLATAGDDATARVVETGTWREAARMEHDGSVEGVVFSPDGRWLATRSGDTVHVFEGEVWRRVTLLTHDGAVEAVGFSPDGRSFVTRESPFDGTGNVRLVATGVWQSLDPLPLEGSPVSLAFSPDGEWLAARSTQPCEQRRELTHSTRVWATASGEQVGWMSDDNVVCELGFVVLPALNGSDDAPPPNSGGNLALVEASAEWKAVGPSNASKEEDPTDRWRAERRGQSVHVVDIPAGREIAAFGHGSAVNGMVFDPDGRWLVTASDSGAHVWPLQAEDLIAQACARLPRNLTQEEWSRYVSDPEADPAKACPELP